MHFVPSSSFHLLGFFQVFFCLIQLNHLMVHQQFGTFFVLSIPSTSQVPQEGFMPVDKAYCANKTLLRGDLFKHRKWLHIF